MQRKEESLLYFSMLKDTTASAIMLSKAQLANVRGNLDETKALLSDYFASEQESRKNTLLEDMKFDVWDDKIDTLSINSVNQELAPTIYGNKLVFTSNRYQPRIQQKINSSDQSGMFHLMEGVFVEDGSIKNIKPFDRFDFGSGHVGKLAINENHLVICMTSASHEIKSKSMVVVRKLQLFESRKVDEVWGDLKPISFCKKEFNYIDPFLSATGNELYFSSDESGSMDIYRVVYTDNKGWGIPELIDDVNTPGNEIGPTRINDQLIFASDTWPGYGGYDLFQYDLNTASLSNFGLGVNSNLDDVDIVIGGAGSFGFFVRNKINNRTDYDILQIIFDRKRFVLNSQGD